MKTWTFLIAVLSLCGGSLGAAEARPNVLFIAIDGLRNWMGCYGDVQAKAVLWEESARAPLLWVVPGVTRPGGVCARAVDFLSIFPTLCDLTGLPSPAQCQDPSLRPLLADSKAAWDRPALTTMGRGNHAVRDERWRYIRYADGGEELYDHNADPLEWTNLASKPEWSSVKARLARWLPAQDAPDQGRGEAGKAQKAGKRKKKTQ